MGVTERRERERQETREKILNAARELFATRGIEATTVRAIAARIEYTPAAIYHHFRDKEDLLLNLVHADFRTLAQTFRQIGRIDDPMDRLVRIGETYARFATEFPHHYRLMFMTVTPAPEVEGEAHRTLRGNPEEDAYAFLRMTVVEAMEGGLLRKGLDDPDQVAQMVWATVHGVVSLAMAKSNDPWIEWRDPMETSRLAVSTILHGIRRAPDP